MLRATPFLVLGALFLASEADAQMCPFNVTFANSGSSCTQSGAMPPTVTGSYSNGNSGCSVTLTLGVPPFCCNVFVTGRFLVLGGQAVTVPVPGGCNLLVFPDVVLTIPASPLSVTFPLPPDPALVGLVVHAQGIVVRFTTIGMTTDFDFSSRLDISFQ
ncbi:MAG TPA: hypothetical protein VKF62_12995 [Planctomycetota bacterium]|nr:hypothetical protein [Planctomycetota bacterium]